MQGFMGRASPRDGARPGLLSKAASGQGPSKCQLVSILFVPNCCLATVSDVFVGLKQHIWESFIELLIRSPKLFGNDFTGTVTYRLQANRIQRCGSKSSRNKPIKDLCDGHKREMHAAVCGKTNSG